MPTIDPFLPRTRIAYFTMEIAILPEMHAYAGGLGVLAGDTARSCSAIGERKDDRHVEALLDKLETKVLPLFYENRGRWIWMMKETISKIGARSSSQYMMRRYASEAYLR